MSPLRPVLSLVAIAMLSAGCGSTAAPSAAPSTSARATSSAPSASGTAAAPSCIEHDALGRFVSRGGQGVEVTTLGTEMMTLLEAHPAASTGAGYCSDYRGMRVALPTSDRTLEPQVRALVAKHPGMRLEIAWVPASRAQIEQAQRAVLDDPALTKLLTGVGGDLDGHLSIDLAKVTSPADAARHLALINDFLAPRGPVRAVWSGRAGPAVAS